MLDDLILFYLVTVLLLFWRIAKKGTLYICSPLLVVELPFITQCLLPYWIFSKAEDYDPAFSYVILTSVIVHLSLLYLFRNLLLTPIHFVEPYFPKKKCGILLLSLLLVLGAGLYSGVTLGLLRGANVENLRRSNEIGLGVVTEIPIFIIQILTLSLLLGNKKKNVLEAFVFVSGIGVLLFLSKGHKAVFASVILLFLIYFNIRKRGFRFYEYILFYFIQPLVAALLQTLRGGSVQDLADNVQTFVTYPFLLFQVNIVPVVNKISESTFLYGIEYFSAAVQFIPRFLWENKPVAFDYYYKDLIGYDFDGGGVPIPNEFSFYVNFSYMAPLFLFLWNALIFFFYKKVVNSTNRYMQILLLILLVGPLRPSVVIPRLEWAILATMVFAFYYKRKRILDI